MLRGPFAHRKPFPMVPDEQAGHDHGDWPGHVQPERERVGKHDQSERDQHLDRVVINGSQRAVGNEPKHPTQHQSPTHFLEEK